MSLLIDRICAADRGKTNVLVVDDVLPILEEMLTLLELTDIPAVAASSLDEAVLALEECQNISVVVCDVYLGKESGLDLIERARAADKHIVLPEGEDDRILRAAATLLARGVARLTILGEPFEVGG